jgi:hypothetical protein
MPDRKKNWGAWDLVNGFRLPHNRVERQHVRWWNRGNQHVYDEFNRRTWKLIRARFKYYSAHAILYSIRYDWDVEGEDETQDAERTPIKIANGRSPLLARLWMEKYPEWAGFFRTVENDHWDDFDEGEFEGNSGEGE